MWEFSALNPHKSTPRPCHENQPFKCDELGSQNLAHSTPKDVPPKQKFPTNIHPKKKHENSPMLHVHLRPKKKSIPFFLYIKRG